MPDDPDLWLPPSGPQAELATFQTQSSLVGSTKLDPAKLDTCSSLVAKFLPHPVWVDRSVEEFAELAIRDLEPTSTPGYPYHRLGHTIGAVLADPVVCARIKKEACARVRKLASLRPEEVKAGISLDPCYALKTGISDPLKLIIKKEPTSGKKIRASKWRFILAMSLVDQLVERILFRQQNNAEIEAWADISSKPGMGESDEDTQLLADFVQHNGLNVTTDASGWDNSVPADLLVEEAERRIKCCPSAPSWWCAAVRNVMFLSTVKITLLSDGTLWARVIPGAMASGRYVTSSSNSAIRAMVDRYVDATKDTTRPASMCMGDDAASRVDGTKEDYVTRVKTLLGITLTDATDVTSKEFEFCSRLVVDGKPVHQKPFKSLAKVLLGTAGEVDVQIARRTSLSREWRYVEHKERFLAALDFLHTYATPRTA